MRNNTYKMYFNIDPEYLAQINEAEIESHPDLWKKFYPHETFVKLLKDTISVLSRRQKCSLWVEGAYGTGKSHAVLTLKKLLDASEEDTKAYFDKYNDELDTDLFNKFQQIKSGDQKILTVHRYGSSKLHGDDDLVFAIQQSVIAALKETGAASYSEDALMDSAVAWLSDPINKNYFNELIRNKYTDLFAGADVDSILEDLQTYAERAQRHPSRSESLSVLMGKIMKAAEEQGIFALKLSTTSLLKWLTSVIEKNNFKAILFIWDEFSDYFRNNKTAMTGLQEIADFSGDKPFYLMIVTHSVMHMFPETDKDWKRLKDRFIMCNIELRENIAFRLMGSALEKNSDTQVQQDWETKLKDLTDRTENSRKLVREKAKITDKELINILPIHPYAALLLKYISSAFNSNQRSMFDFIKNDRGDEVKGFQWFINNYGPLDNNPLLTVDMLWDFFYERGKEHLAPDIRAILDCYAFSSSENLNYDEKRVLKAVLLMQAISRRTGDTVPLFTPNEKNLDNAFEGSDIEGEAVHIANTLVGYNILFKKTMPGGKTQYSALIHSGNSAEIEKEKEEQKKKSTSLLLQEAEMREAFALPGALRLRYDLHFVSYNDFKITINRLRGAESAGNHISAVVCFAKDDTENLQILKAIREAAHDESYSIVFIDASSNPLGNDLLDQYAEAMANSVAHIKEDRGLAAQYEANAKEALRKWRRNVASGEFVVYTSDKPDGERAATMDQLFDDLRTIDRHHYSEGLETYGSVNDTMWQATGLESGVQCGAEENLKGQYNAGNEKTNLENFIGKEAWKVPEYWKSAPHLRISKLKIEIDTMIRETCESEGRISIAQIYDFLQDKDGKYGFMTCNLTAFVMGFLLKEYTDGTYNYSDGTVTNVLDVGKLKAMVAEIMKQRLNPNPRYKDKFIVTTTPEEKAFYEASSKIFGISQELCSSVEQTRDRIRQKMKELSFPIWVLQYQLPSVQLTADAKTVTELIDDYTGIANNQNYVTPKTESDIAINIGKLCLKTPGAAEDLAALVNKDMCLSGMSAYLRQYRDGILPKLGEEVNDGGQYLNRLKQSFDADAANWVWNRDTANRKIDEVILEYQIMAESNKILPKNMSFESTIGEWLDKCGMIRISYLYAKNYWEDLSELMELLYEMKKSGSLSESRRAKFLEQISTNGKAFRRFYDDQTVLFKKACDFIVGQFDDDEISQIFRLLPTDLFTDEKNKYQATVREAVDRYLSEQSTAKLKELWAQKTATDTPKDWSDKYRMPILCMIPDRELQAAKGAFETLNSKKPDKDSIEKAMEFLQRTDFYDRLASEEERDKAFRENIIKSYAVMLDDLDEVKEHLMNTLSFGPYEWFGAPEVEKQLKQMAEYKYNESGCERALSKIDEMDVADVKSYLKQLIKDNMTVGLEIIKGK